MALQDYYNDTDDVDDHEFFDDDTYFAQTFVANQDYTITSVKLLIGWYVSYEPGTNVIVSIRATTDYLGIPALGRIPTGDDLCSKSIACSSLPEYPDLISPPKTWTEITFDTPLALISGTEYAIVLRTDHPLSDIVWQKDASDSYYTFGNYAFYNGIFWTSILRIFVFLWIK